MDFVKRRDLVQDHVGKQRLCSDRAGIIKRAPVDPIWIAPEHFHFARCLSRRLFDTEQDRDVLITVQAIRNEKRNGNHVGLRRHFPPVRHQRFFLHEHAEDLRVIAACPDPAHLFLHRRARVFIERSAVPDDQQSRLAGRDAGSHPGCAVQQQLGHPRMIAHRLAVFDHPPPP